MKKKGVKLVVKGSPWITTQDFGQIVVFNVEKTVNDTQTQVSIFYFFLKKKKKVAWLWFH